MTDENNNEHEIDQEIDQETESVSAIEENTPDGNASESGVTHEETQGLLEDARSKADEHFDKLVRLQAEMDNLRKRSSRDLESAHKFALEKFAIELLPVIDSMEMGMAAASSEGANADSMKEGIDLTLKMFQSTLSKFSIEEIVHEKDEKLNPEFHQAITMQEDDSVEPNTILTVVQKGYTLNERLVRPSMVIVAKATENISD